MKCDKEPRGTSQKVTTCMYVCVCARVKGVLPPGRQETVCELSEVTGWF